MAVVPNTLVFTTQCKEMTLPENIVVNLDPKYDRKKSSDLEKEVDHTWDLRLAALPSMFNGTKFRLDSLEEKDGKVHFNLGITCYKNFQGTNLSVNMLVLQSQGLCDHDNSQAYMSDALGVGALVITSDNNIVLLFRSKKCGEDTNLWDRPGGHPEPKAVVGKLPMEEINLQTMDKKAVIAELFNSIIEEVVSEVNIPANVLEPARILGLHRSNLNGGKPNIEFLVRCHLSSSEVEALYKQGNQVEAYESEQIMFLPMEKALSLQLCDLDLWNKMAAGAKGMLTLYNMYKHRFL